MSLKGALRRYVGAEEELEEATSRTRDAEARADRAERRAQEYFLLLERLEKQRDEWKQMWFTQVGQHQEAQSMLESALVGTRQLLAGAVAELNMHRKDKGLALITEPKDLRAPPVGASVEYGQRMKELEDSAPAGIDVEAEVKKIESA